MTTTLEPGQPAPTFDLPADDGSRVSLEALRGSWVVLYFYPKDNTPGCTTEACDFRDMHDDFASLDAVILGVSPDSEKSHVRFRDKHELPFRLLVDSEHEAMAAYGAWGEKKMYGRTFMGVIRSTFLIDPDGKLAAVWPKVRVKGHVAKVREALVEARG